MEARLVGRLQRRRDELNAVGESRRGIFSGRVMFAGAMFAACVLVAVLVRHRDRAPVKPAAVVAGISSNAVPPVKPPVLVSAPAYGAVGTTHHTRVLRTPVRRDLVSFPAPEEPLTKQEKLLVAIAQSPKVLTGLRSVATSETVADHGLGKNAIFELDHEEFAELKTTLQVVPLKNTLPQPNHPGDIE